MANRQSKKVGKRPVEPRGNAHASVALRDLYKTDPPVKPIKEKPPIDYVAAALAGSLAHLSTNPLCQLSRQDIRVLVRYAFDVAEQAHMEEKSRYE